MAKKKDSKFHTIHVRIDKDALEATNTIKALLAAWGQKASQSSAIRFAVLKIARDLERGALS